MSVPASLAAIAAAADVRFNGDRPWDPQVHDRRLYRQLLQGGSLALGNGYVRGAWDCQQLDELIGRLLRLDANRPLSLQALGWDWLRWLMEQLINPQSLRRAFRVGCGHYDLDPRVYAAMLGPHMAYSCGYWRDADDLATAQEHKLRLICDKLELRPGLRLLDVGCGWGSLAAYACRHYGVEVLGITVSQQQARWIRERLGHLPLQVELCDYRQLPAIEPEPFDRIASVGMFEHVGRRNDRCFFRTLQRLLRPDGLALLHTIGFARTTHRTDAWIDAHVFPGGRLPSAGQLAQAVEPCFLIEDWENFGPDYDRTLLAWWGNFEAAWPQLMAEQWSAASSTAARSPEFFRFWRYYLLSCAGFFRSRQGQLWQVVLSRPERSQPYRSWRPPRPSASVASVAAAPDAAILTGGSNLQQSAPSSFCSWRGDPVRGFWPDAH
jgi:cyclopropane-fatty-acyl-phospholipid synthase